VNISLLPIGDGLTLAMKKWFNSVLSDFVLL
jgi:hypothetical protein